MLTRFKQNTLVVGKKIVYSVQLQRMRHAESSMAGIVVTAGVALAIGAALARPHLSLDKSANRGPTPQPTPTSLVVDATSVTKTPDYELPRTTAPEATHSPFINDVSYLQFIVGTLPLSARGAEILGLDDTLYDDQVMEHYFAQGAIEGNDDVLNQTTYDMFLFDTRDPIQVTRGIPEGSNDIMGKITFSINEQGTLRQHGDADPLPMNELTSFAMSFFELPENVHWTWTFNEQDCLGGAKVGDTAYFLKIDKQGNVTFFYKAPNTPAIDAKKVS